MRSPRLPLSLHPATPASVPCAINVGVERKDSTLVFTYSLDAPLNRLLIPAATSPWIVLGLWEHTCFEAFVALDGSAAYHEFNFSPSGDWAAFSFSAYRDGFEMAAQAAPRLAVQQQPHYLSLEAIVSLDALSPLHPTSVLRVAAAAVVEAADASLSYWALRHPPGKPDFHHHDAFAVLLEAPNPA